VRNLQPADERERRDIFTVVGHLGKLVLKGADAQLVAVTGSHFDNEEATFVLLGFSIGGILGEEHLGYLFKVVEQMQRQRVKPIRGHTFQTGRKC